MPDTEIVSWDTMEQFEDGKRRGWIAPGSTHFVEETGETFIIDPESGKEPVMATAAAKPKVEAPEGNFFDLLKTLELETPCPDCEGKGCHHNPRWTEWRDLRAQGIEKPPPFDGAETMRCHRCRGNGFLPSPLGQKILDFVRRHGT